MTSKTSNRPGKALLSRSAVVVMVTFAALFWARQRLIAPVPRTAYAEITLIATP